jgi:hypothetical protein
MAERVGKLRVSMCESGMGISPGFAEGWAEVETIPRHPRNN